MKSNKPRKFTEWLSIQVVKNPSRVILFGIIIINIIFIFLSAFIITVLSPVSGQERDFFDCLFYTITMVMDAGCVSFIVKDPNHVSAVIVVLCLIIILVGMIVFTGGIIGYVSNSISNFIDNSNAGKSRLIVSNHTIILNWNSRASEIINDLLYSEFPETVVVLVHERKEEVEAEIEDRLLDSVARERKKIFDEAAGMGLFNGFWYVRKNQFHSRVTVIVRQGDTFSNKQLMDISVDKAKAIIILNKDRVNTEHRRGDTVPSSKRNQGNSLTVKTLALVAELTADELSADDQKIIVEIEDKWTGDIVNKIISHKENIGKCNIVPIHVNNILGQLLAQFSIMPELNLVYSELFSNKGAEFYSVPADNELGIEDDYLKYFENHARAIPLTFMDTKSGRQLFFMADRQHDLIQEDIWPRTEFHVQGNPDLWQPRRNILILGHNSKVPFLMAAFQSYRNEWNPAKDGRDILNICVLDDEKGLEKMNYYKDFSYVSQVINTDIYNDSLIYDAVNRFIDDQDGDTGILILSDDSVLAEDLDANALTYLIYVQDILSRRKEKLAGEEDERIDVVVEILNPKNYDVVRSYSVDNVVISNRYISKMITQIGEKDTLFEFYSDILTYDDADSDQYISKELYVKRVGDIFLSLPEKCTADQLIRAIYIDNKRFGADNLTILLGYISSDRKMVIFAGDQRSFELELQPDDKLILFSNH